MVWVLCGLLCLVCVCVASLTWTGVFGLGLVWRNLEGKKISFASELKKKEKYGFFFNKKTTPAFLKKKKYF
jgi:hypothetical protein